jgi:hypothetical protein
MVSEGQMLLDLKEQECPRRRRRYDQRLLLAAVFG